MTVAWQKHVTASGPNLPPTLSVDREGQVAVGVVFNGVFDFGGGAAPLISPPTGASFLADPLTGRVVLAVGFQGVVDFGGGLLQTMGAPADIAVVSLSP